MIRLPPLVPLLGPIVCVQPYLSLSPGCHRSTTRTSGGVGQAQPVADELGLNEADIEAVYGPNDSHDTDWKIREIWKYATGKGVNGTPFAFINGVKVDSVPTTVTDWVDLLNSVYSSLYQIFSSLCGCNISSN